MSRRTLIKQWNPAVPIVGRGRGGRKRGSDPARPFENALRTVYDPAESRQSAGRDTGGARFYSASGLDAAGVPHQDDRFRARTISSRGGRRGRAAVQQRVGMFRNAVQSNVIFGANPSERIIRHASRRINRLIAPDSDVNESANEWQRSPTRQGRRGTRDVYEYETAEEPECEDRREDRPIRRDTSKNRRPDPRRDPNYDPYEFRDEDDSPEGHLDRYRNRRIREVDVPREAVPSTSREPSDYARERLRKIDQRVQPRRLFDDYDEEGEYRPREERREGREENEGRRVSERMERRASKRPRDKMLRSTAAAAASAALQRHVQPRTSASTSSSIETEEEGEEEQRRREKEILRLNYTPSIASTIASRILSGLPPIRLKDDDGTQSYLSASRAIINSAIDRFTDNKYASSPSRRDERPLHDTGSSIVRAFLDRTQHISVSEGDTDDEEDEREAMEWATALIPTERGIENIFSTHNSDEAPILEKLFEESIRRPERVEFNDEEMDPAKILGLGELTDGPEGGVIVDGDREDGADSDPFAVQMEAGSSEDSVSSNSDHSSRPSSIFSNGSRGGMMNMILPLEQQRLMEKSSGSSSYSSDHSLDSVGNGRDHHYGYLQQSQQQLFMQQLQQTQMQQLQQTQMQQTYPSHPHQPMFQSQQHHLQLLPNQNNVLNLSQALHPVSQSFQFQVNGQPHPRIPAALPHHINNNGNGSFNFEF